MNGLQFKPPAVSDYIVYAQSIHFINLANNKHHFNNAMGVFVVGLPQLETRYHIKSLKRKYSCIKIKAILLLEDTINNFL